MLLKTNKKNKQNKIINRKTELCHHCPLTKAHSNENENNTHKAEQSLPAWRGAAGVVGARGRCCPAATVPAAVVFACGVRRCIAEIAEKKQNIIVNRKTELCHHRPKSKAHSNEYENNTHKADQSLPAWRGAGRSNRATRPVLSSTDGCLLYTSPSPRD